MALIVAFSLCCICNISIAIASSHVVVPLFSGKHTVTPLEIGLILVPRVTMMLVSWFCFLLFSISLSWFEKEPVLWLPDFMNDHVYPTVDIFLPRYKEEWNLYEATVGAALAIDYPPHLLNVYICDDGSRAAPIMTHLIPYLHGHTNLHYLSRSDGLDAKAGNMNNALRHSFSELIVVLDADHCAHPNFLLRTIPHLLVTNRYNNYEVSSKIAFVQTTQVFHNARERLVRMLDGSHMVFYRLMMASYSGMGCSPCVGTGYVMQRRALEDIGGSYVAGCAVEDIVTGLAMHDKGWSSKYLDCELVIGLSPATLSEFYLQRERWVAGSAQLLIYKNPLRMRNMALQQRLAYVVGSWYWLVILGLMALLVVRILLWAVFRIVSGVHTNLWLPSIAEYAPVYLALLVLPNITMEGKVANLVAVFTFFPTYISVFSGWLVGTLNPNKHSFKVTSAAEAFGDSWPSLATYNVTFVVCMCALFGLMWIPQLHLIHTTLDIVVPSAVLCWTLIVNFPVLYVLMIKVFRFVTH